MQKYIQQKKKKEPTSLFKTRVSVKCLASLPNGSGATSVNDAEEAASLWADVTGCRFSPEISPFVSSVVTSLSGMGSLTGLLPIEGAYFFSRETALSYKEKESK